jgi:hypothetical protein
MALRVPGAGAHARGPRAARRAGQGRLTRSQKAKVRWLDGEYERVSRPKSLTKSFSHLPMSTLGSIHVLEDVTGEGCQELTPPV